jgi:hypothetical protein
MLQTTAAVHPGGSGGAVVDADGRLIGLVTSAARHSGGSMLPHLNFSIPVEALKPVFDFASSGNCMWFVRDVDDERCLLSFKRWGGGGAEGACYHSSA